MPGAMAYDPDNTHHLALSPPQQISAPQQVMADDIALRGHLTTIPQGTIIMIKMDQPLNSASSKLGDPVSATIENDIYLDNQIVVPAGSQIQGSVASVNPAAHLGRAGSIELQFHNIKTTYGNVYPIRAHLVTNDNTGILKGDSDQAQIVKSLGTAAAVTGASTIMGTAAGSILGSAGGGAAFGLAAGAIGGIGYAIVRQGKQVVIPGGARMSIILDQPVATN